nr:hypothetical protein CFP56_12105 [Quercus suber]
MHTLPRVNPVWRHRRMLRHVKHVFGTTPNNVKNRNELTVDCDEIDSSSSQNCRDPSRVLFVKRSRDKSRMGTDEALGWTFDRHILFVLHLVTKPRQRRG